MFAVSNWCMHIASYCLCLLSSCRRYHQATWTPAQHGGHLPDHALRWGNMVQLLYGCFWLDDVVSIACTWSHSRSAFSVCWRTDWGLQGPSEPPVPGSSRLLHWQWVLSSTERILKFKRKDHTWLPAAGSFAVICKEKLAFHKRQHKRKNTQVYPFI